jgi:hypothetical protein
MPVIDIARRTLHRYCLQRALLDKRAARDAMLLGPPGSLAYTRGQLCLAYSDVWLALAKQFRSEEPDDDTEQP